MQENKRDALLTNSSAQTSDFNQIILIFNQITLDISKNGLFIASKCPLNRFSLTVKQVVF